MRLSFVYHFISYNMNKNIKKYLLRFFAFFAIPYISLLLIDLILSHNYVWKGNYFCSWNHLYYDKEDDDLLIFGSSRAQVHFVSNIISDSLNLKVHNFGLPGASINYSYIQLLEYLKYHKTPPKYATLEVCFHTLMPRPLPYHWQMMPKMLYNFRMYKYCGHPDYFPLYYFTIPLWRYVHYFDDLKLFKRDTYISCKDCGYVGEGDKYVSSRNLELGGLCASYEPYNEEQFKMLQKFILLCKKKQYKIITYLVARIL